MQRKVLRTNDFLDLADVVARLEAFENHYYFIAKLSTGGRARKWPRLLARTIIGIR